MSAGLRAIHQFVPSFASRDAIGGHVVQVQRTLRDIGLDSEIYVVDAHNDVGYPSAHYKRCVRDEAGETAILYHLSIGSEMAKYLVDRPEPLIVDFHNITPQRFLNSWHSEAAYAVTTGWQQVPMLARRTSIALADSAFNAGDLEANGYRDVAVVPILLDFETFERGIDKSFARELEKSASSRWLFVGRIVPNKAQHDLIRAFAVYRKLYDPNAQLDIVGGTSSAMYLAVLEKMIVQLNLEDSVRLHGSVSDAELGAFYEASSVLVCVSEHEGFCVPLIEAMYHGLPVVAFSAGAVPETLGSAGLLLDTKGPARVAAAVHRVVSDDVLRAEMVAAGHERVEHFSLNVARRRLIDSLAPLLGDDAGSKL